MPASKPRRRKVLRTPVQARSKATVSAIIEAAARILARAMVGAH
jgi:hypothetical protein